MGSLTDRMNVLFAVVDDLRPELGCYGKEQIISPNIDNLARDGILFERAYCQQAVCAPSRSSVLSGCRPDTTMIYDLATPLRKLMPDILSLPEHFRNNGYETVSVGKVYHHPRDDLQGWSKEPFRSRGDWKGRGYLTDEAVEAMKKNEEFLRQRNDRRTGLGPAFEAADVPDNAYHDGMDADAAIDELRLLKDKTFFLGLGFHKPHLPFNAPKRYWDMYPPEKIRLAENPFEPEGVTEYSLTNFGELRGYFGMAKTGPVPDDQARQLIHGYSACVSYVDAQFGRVIGELERLKLRDRTIIILWGDHGWKLGEHASWCKHTNFEVDARAPMIISVPGMKKAGEHTYALTEFVDMYPTLCELCCLPIPEHVEGLSFAPVLEKPNRPWKESALSQYPRGSVMGYTLRTDRYRYTQWQDRKSGEVKARELYDHQNDSQENVNAISRPEYAEEIRKLEALMRQGWRGVLPE
jgi:iduronate 2-sulfatase